jgi:Rrf2 family nitric oxide-sensitive transcriptional repressor
MNKEEKMYSQTAQLGIKATIVIGREAQGQPLAPALIAESLQCSLSYLKKVLAALTKADVLTAVRGKHGGVMLAREPKSISLCEIIEATQGFILADYCQDLGDLPIRPCGFHRAMAEIHHGIISVLERWTLAHLLLECAPINTEGIPISCKMVYNPVPFNGLRKEKIS